MVLYKLFVFLMMMYQRGVGILLSCVMYFKFRNTKYSRMWLTCVYLCQCFPSHQRRFQTEQGLPTCMPGIFRRFREIVKSDFWLWHSCLSEWNNSALTGRIFVRFRILILYSRFRASWLYINKIQQDAPVCRYLFTAISLYMFRVSIAPIIRRT